MKPTQRFVAGASCPSCGAEDALLIDTIDQSIECVDCGYTQSPEERDQPKQKTASVKKVKTADMIQITNLKD